MAQMRNIHIPGLSDLPVVGELLFSYNPFVYLGIIDCGEFTYINTGWFNAGDRRKIRAQQMRRYRSYKVEIH